MIKQYSQAAHLIHSRMQLVRHRMLIHEHDHPANIVHTYRKIFNKAAESILIHHGVSSEYKDICNAAEMLYHSIYPPLSKSYYQYYVAQYKASDKIPYVDIGDFDEQGNIVPPDPNERLSFKDAGRRIMRLAAPGRPGKFNTVMRMQQDMIDPEKNEDNK